MPLQEHRFDAPEVLNQHLADAIAETLGAAVASRGSAVLVVSGGRTPLPLFHELAQRSLPWSEIWITLADERWVTPDHKDSNEALVRQHLLQGPASAARFVPLKNSAATPEAGEADCAQALAALPRPFDVVILGMGDDGHTASLFPQAPQLQAALTSTTTPCMAVDPVTVPHARMSLTLSALLESRRIVLHMVGDGKWRVYQQAAATGPVEEFPVRAVLQQNEVPVHVYWSP